MPDRFERRMRIIEIACIVIGGGVAIAALFFTGSQIQNAAEQLQASTVYQIKKDGRELFGTVFEDRPVYRYIFDYDSNATYDEDLLERAGVTIGTVFQFYSAVYDQVDAGFIDETHVQSLGADLCGFARRPPVAERAQHIINSPAYSAAFRSELSRCAPGG